VVQCTSTVIRPYTVVVEHEVFCAVSSSGYWVTMPKSITCPNTRMSIFSFQVITFFASAPPLSQFPLNVNYDVYNGIVDNYGCCCFSDTHRIAINLIVMRGVFNYGWPRGHVPSAPVQAMGFKKGRGRLFRKSPALKCQQRFLPARHLR
jgi:hypothetical protein